ncbi:MAG: pilus assembly protein PilZ [Micavibrio aeruginosavorus]|uniref:Pilus assembly protein PilZ n=1 Tax=Micavibrio aeruginosavorus TaxID=349221 RepID=A0A2W5FLH5_9BACT|nr:MAG: pilus assembly protein PilZ [Micavibrio aeruginosavorus]
MIAKLMTVFSSDDIDDVTNDALDMSRREHPRRAADKCIGLVNGQALPILDWSQGGLRVLGDSRTVSIGDEMNVMLKFHLNNEMIDVNHRAKVVRKSSDFFAVKFAPLTNEIKNTFQQIIDSFNAEEFATSQAH